jgi:hypothetical protein
VRKFWSAVGGRKFFGLGIATVLLCYHLIPAEIWFAAYLLFCGANVYQDYLGVKRKKE